MSNQIQTRNMNSGIYGNNRVVVGAAENTSIRVDIGPIRPDYKTADVNGNYPSEYNHAAKLRDSFNQPGERTKRMMRGGRLLLYPKMVALMAIVSLVFAALSIRWKYFVSIPILLSLIYMILSCYNLHIGRTNGSLFCDLMWPVSKDTISMTAQYFYIPLYGQIESDFIYGIVQNNAALFARLRSEYSNSTEITIMLYTPTHKGYTEYKAKSLGQFFLFFMIFFFAIIMVASSIEVY